MPWQPSTHLESVLDIIRGSVLSRWLRLAPARTDIAPTFSMACLPMRDRSALPILPMEAYAHPRHTSHSRVAGAVPDPMKPGTGHLRQNRYQKKQSYGGEPAAPQHRGAPSRCETSLHLQPPGGLPLSPVWAHSDSIVGPRLTHRDPPCSMPSVSCSLHTTPGAWALGAKQKGPGGRENSVDKDREAPVGLARLRTEGLWWELLGRLKPGCLAPWLWGCSLKLRKLTLGVTPAPSGWSHQWPLGNRPPRRTLCYCSCRIGCSDPLPGVMLLSVWHTRVGA